MAPDAPALPDDFGKRIRAAAAYAGLGKGLGIEQLADALDRPGMTRSTLRNYVEKGKLPRPLAREAFIKRLSEVSGLPEAFFLGAEGRASVDVRLSEIDDQVRRLSAETAVRDAEALRQIEEVLETIRRFPPPPQP